MVTAGFWRSTEIGFQTPCFPLQRTVYLYCVFTEEQRVTTSHAEAIHVEIDMSRSGGSQPRYSPKFQTCCVPGLNRCG